MVAQKLRDGSLLEVLPEFKPKPKPVSIVYPNNRHLSAKVRVFADWIAELFESTPALADGDTRRVAVPKRETQQADHGPIAA